MCRKLNFRMTCKAGARLDLSYFVYVSSRPTPMLSGSQYMKHRDDSRHRSAVSGKLIKLKVKKSSKDKEVSAGSVQATREP